jgi:hypothetical protein
VTIDVLPDDVLLEIFDVYLGSQIRSKEPDVWHKLVHVCQRWRNIVLASPQRLNLQLNCSPFRPVKRMLHVWPQLPVLISSFNTTLSMWQLTNVIAALEEHNRVCDIYIDHAPNYLLKFFAAMKDPFPKITRLFLRSATRSVPVLPDLFLGGSAPLLRELELDGITFPALPKLLLSASGLVYLSLWNIPRSGYISPEAIITALSALTRLKSLSLGFRSRRSRANRASRSPLPLIRVTLHSLTFLGFKCNSQYLEDIVSRIDAPLLDNVAIAFFDQLGIVTPHLSHFINRTETFNAPHRAHVFIHDYRVHVMLYRKKGSNDHKTLMLRISCKPSDSHLSSFVQIYNSVLAPLPTLERLDIDEKRMIWHADMESTQWQEALRPFTSVKDLRLSEKLESAPSRLIAPVLSNLAEESVTEVLPVLQSLFVRGALQSGSIQEAIDKFVAARQLAGRPITIHRKEIRRQIC